jgi:hypothetical protein
MTDSSMLVVLVSPRLANSRLCAFDRGDVAGIVADRRDELWEPPRS